MARPKKNESEENKDIRDPIESILNNKEFDGLYYGTRSGDEIISQDIITTSSFFFDDALGGGFHGGSWARFLSDPEAGKTSMALCWGRNWQQKYPENGFVVYFNAEGRITKDLLERTGVDTNKQKFRIIDCNNADVIYTIVERLLTQNQDELKYFVIIDSTDSCQRSIDIGKNLGESEKIGGGATIASAAGKRLSLMFNRLGGHFLFLCSQVRDKLNMGKPGVVGKDASGGNAPKFYSSLIGQIKTPWTETYIYENPSDNKSKIIGREVEIKLLKTYNEKTGTVVKYPVKYGLKGGIWRSYEAMMMCQAWNFYIKSGPYFKIDDAFAEELKKNNVNFEITLHGEKALRDFFDMNLDIVNYVFEKGKNLI